MENRKNLQEMVLVQRDVLMWKNANTSISINLKKIKLK